MTQERASGRITLEAASQMYVEPAECIHCGACNSSLTSDAIFPLDEVPADKSRFIALNEAHFACVRKSYDRQRSAPASCWRISAKCSRHGSSSGALIGTSFGIRKRQEIQMSRFLSETMTDILRGRESWRVFVALGTPSFLVAVGVTLMQLG